MIRRRVAVLVVLLCALTACSHSTEADVHAHMTVTPGPALEDTTVDVRVSGLPTGATVTLSASATDSHHVRWASSANFRVPSDGVVTLAQPSTSGSYTGKNPLGLLLFMKPPTADAVEDPSFYTEATGYPVQFTASLSGKTVATGTTRRIFGVPSTTIRHFTPGSDGIYGDLFTPKQSGRHPAILAFGGSEGGESMFTAAGELAAAGYPTLALAYFKEPGLPQNLSNIPLEYFEHALRILRAQPDVDPHHVIVFGVSRGGEGALLVGAAYPSLVNAVIAGVPSYQVNGSYPGGSGYAWTLHGAQLQPGTSIPVEKIDGPILEACGGKDTTWASCAYIDQIGARLRAHHFSHPVRVLRYPRAGHTAGALFCCTSNTKVAYADHGGSVVANQAAAVAGHRALLRWLAQQ